MSIQTTSVARALELIAPRMGLTVSDNRVELLDVLDEIRSLLYSSYKRYAIAVDRKVCIPVEDYCLDCNRCKDTYRGITLPYDAATPESIKLFDYEITRKSEYKDFHQCGCLEGWDVAGRIPTQKDITCGCAGQLLLHSNSKDDNGKKARITFLDSDGTEREEEIVFGEKTRTEKAASRVLQVMLPHGRAGSVNIYWKDGDQDIHLSTYRRSELVPNYVRVRLNASCKSINLDVIYAREHFQVFDDEEVVETGNVYALREFAAYVSINSRRNNSGTDRQEALVHLSQAEMAIQGLMSRSTGASQDHKLIISGPMHARSGLISKRGRWR